MPQQLDTATLHKYVMFLAKQVTDVIRSGAEEEKLERLHVELDRFDLCCKSDQPPDELRARYGSLLNDYKRSVAKPTIAAGLFDTLIGAIAHGSFRYTRIRRLVEILQGLKTDLKALAMHTKLRY